jgi:hypothetical protein
METDAVPSIFMEDKEGRQKEKDSFFLKERRKIKG